MTKTVGGPHGSAAARRKTGSHIHSRSKYTNFFRGFPSSAGTFFFQQRVCSGTGRRIGERQSGGVSREEGAGAMPGARRTESGTGNGRAGRGTGGRTTRQERADRLKDGKRTGRTETGGQVEERETGGQDGERQDGRRRLRRKKRGPGTLRVSGPFLSRMRRTIWPGTRRPSRRSPRRAGRVPRSCRRGQRG